MYMIVYQAWVGGWEAGTDKDISSSSSCQEQLGIHELTDSGHLPPLWGSAFSGSDNISLPCADRDCSMLRKGSLAEAGGKDAFQF